MQVHGDGSDRKSKIRGKEGTGHVPLIPTEIEHRRIETRGGRQGLWVAINIELKAQGGERGGDGLKPVVALLHRASAEVNVGTPAKAVALGGESPVNQSFGIRERRAVEASDRNDLGDERSVGALFFEKRIWDKSIYGRAPQREHRELGIHRALVGAVGGDLVERCAGFINQRGIVRDTERHAAANHKGLDRVPGGGNLKATEGIFFAGKNSLNPAIDQGGA